MSDLNTQVTTLKAYDTPITDIEFCDDDPKFGGWSVMELLPAELHVHILSFLPARDLVSFSGVNKECLSITQISVVSKRIQDYKAFVVATSPQNELQRSIRAIIGTRGRKELNSDPGFMTAVRSTSCVAFPVKDQANMLQAAALYVYLNELQNRPGAHPYYLAGQALECITSITVSVFQNSTGRGIGSYRDRFECAINNLQDDQRTHEYIFSLMRLDNMWSNW